LIIALLGVAAMPAAASGRGLHVSGSRLLSGADQPVALHGVNRSGTDAVEGRDRSEQRAVQPPRAERAIGRIVGSGVG
jgi:hypothetical protein